MKIISVHTLTILFTSVILFSSCGISTEVRTASTSLVEKQKSSLAAHIEYHKVTLEMINNTLETLQSRSNTTYKESIENYHQAMLEELKKIYEDKGLSEAQKKVKEEDSRQKIMVLIKEAESNKKVRDGLIKEAQNEILTASVYLIEGERVKLSAIEKLDSYIQAKRPSERLLEAIDLDLEKYSSKIEQVNEAIKKAEPLINKLEK